MDQQAYRIKGAAELYSDPNSLNVFDDTRMCYWHTDAGWELYIPSCGAGLLSKHQVVEHEDGTITVTPSIRMWGHHQHQQIMRHGYLTRGMWHGCEDDAK